VFNFGDDWIWPDPNPTTYVYKTRESALTQPGPVQIFCFIDDNEQTIDDGIFVIGEGGWYDCAADRHSQGANLSFLDGHAEHHRWRTPKALVKPWRYGVSPSVTHDQADHDWLVERLPTQ
jgi:prepilin-type processing-associated H-X9-DG protein